VYGVRVLCIDAFTPVVEVLLFEGIMSPFFHNPDEFDRLARVTTSKSSKIFFENIGIEKGRESWSIDAMVFRTCDLETYTIKWHECIDSSLVALVRYVVHICGRNELVVRLLHHLGLPRTELFAAELVAIFEVASTPSR
jgi:hypothetical protein